MYCAHCGTAAETSDRVCRACGAGLRGMAPVPGQQAQSDAADVGAVPNATSSTPAAEAPAPVVAWRDEMPAAPVAATPSQPGAAAPAEKQPARQPAPSPLPYPYVYPYPYSYAYPYAPAAYHPYPVAYRPYPAYQPPYPYPVYQYAAAAPYYVPYPPPPLPRAPGETYRLVLAWIATFAGGLSLVGGMLLGLIILIDVAAGGANSLILLAGTGGVTLAALLGGVAALVYGILAILRHPSPRFNFPRAWIFLGLTALAVGGGVALWNLLPVPGSALAVLPLVILAGLLPALTILAFTARRLRFPTTWRHLVLSVVYGAVAAVVVAAILEVILQIVIVLVLQALGFEFGASFGLNNFNPSNSGEVIAILLMLSVVAPVVEEGLKPLGAVLLMPRIRGPNEAFLVGLAAGLGFAVVETLTYIGTGQADWVNVAIVRVGAGLLHGVGAGMGAMGWYYLIRGKGIRLRWLRGFGALLYAVVQHGAFNGSTLLTVVPPIGKVLSQPIYLGQLPLGGDTWIALVFYTVILGVLILATWRLRRLSPEPLPPPTPTAPITPGTGAPVGATPQPMPGGAR